VACVAYEKDCDDGWVEGKESGLKVLNAVWPGVQLVRVWWTRANVLRI
jgi:hypothetical protein